MVAARESGLATVRPVRLFGPCARAPVRPCGGSWDAIEQKGRVG